ncbi:MAG: 50S ribosomal protein L22 [Bacteroidetes bacterium]|nr:50S ribosomal protein L22 [Bacteroidia bacterium]MBN8696249.1 50S ribosomal protein L22 [Bacteroidota bacterium]MCK6650279.1 50S ribosomal protein L22 [Bacteroidia bacterium]
MGVRKQQAADARKEANKSRYFAVLRNCPTSPRKMRLLADLIRGKEVYTALNLLKFNPKEASGRLEKLLASAIANYEAKTGERPEGSNLVVKEVFVDSAMQMKRLRTAPQGRANRIRKRSNHVTIVVDKKQEATTTK